MAFTFRYVFHLHHLWHVLHLGIICILHTHAGREEVSERKHLAASWEKEKVYGASLGANVGQI